VRSALRGHCRPGGNIKNCHMRKLVKIAGINVLVFVGLLAAIELGAQIVALARPSYDVLYLQPDRAVGWKLVPDLRFTWTGFEWYADEFSVDVVTNQFGFRDLPRDYAKPSGVSRVAVLGDSFIEALQVPLAKTATQVLERQLNSTSDGSARQPPDWDVLNFAVSNHGVGQYELMWESYASRFHPDYVAIFVAKFHMRRTISKYEYRAFNATRNERLWARPTFREQNGTMVREPARDFDKFIKAQEDVTTSLFDGRRIRRKPPQLITLFYARRLWDDIARLAHGGGRAPNAPADTESEIVALNLRIIDELGHSVARTGARLIVLDASQYFKDDESVSRDILDLCTKQGYGYVPLYLGLMKANADGVPTRWVSDTHFNEAGNAIVAAGLYDWLARYAQGGKLH
jgi:hypothetical protein